MNLFKIIFFTLFNFGLVLAQQNNINNFSQSILKEDFDKLNKMFPTESELGSFSVIIDTLGQYFIGSEKNNYTTMADWQNDLVEYELETVFEFAPEEKIDLLKNKTSQLFGIILQYNPDNQDGLMFQINNNKKYRLIYFNNNEKNKILSISNNEEGWIKTKNFKKNAKNKITIRTRNSKYAFYLNDIKEYQTNLSKKRINQLKEGRFGFNIGPQTKVKIDHLYISADKEYNGQNKLLQLSEEEVQNLIYENEELKKQLELKNNKQIIELNSVIKLLESELQNSNTIKDSLKRINEYFQPYIKLIEPNKDFIHTLTIELKEQMNKNNTLKNEKNQLLDSIQKLTDSQEQFKLEYLNILESLMNKQQSEKINSSENDSLMIINDNLKLDKTNNNNFNNNNIKIDSTKINSTKIDSIKIDSISR